MTEWQNGWPPMQGYSFGEMMKDFDDAWQKHRTACEIAKNLRDKGVDISIIKETTNLSEKEIREL